MFAHSTGCNKAVSGAADDASETFKRQFNEVYTAEVLSNMWWREHVRIVIPHAGPGIAVGTIATFMLAAGGLPGALDHFARGPGRNGLPKRSATSSSRARTPTPEPPAGLPARRSALRRWRDSCGSCAPGSRISRGCHDLFPPAQPLYLGLSRLHLGTARADDPVIAQRHVAAFGHRVARVHRYMVRVLLGSEEAPRSEPVLRALDLGTKPFGVLRRLTLPCLFPALASTAVIAFMARMENGDTTLFAKGGSCAFAADIGALARNPNGHPPLIDALATGVTIPLATGLAGANGGISCDWYPRVLTDARITRAPLGLHLPEQAAGTPVSQSFAVSGAGQGLDTGVMDPAPSRAMRRFSATSPRNAAATARRPVTERGRRGIDAG